MADLEAVLADVSYLMAMEKSKGAPASRAGKRMQLPDPSIRCLMLKYLTEKNKINFDEIFDQEIGYNLFKEFCTQKATTVPQLHLYDQIIKYNTEDVAENRAILALDLLDECIKEEISSDKEVPSDALNIVIDKMNEKEFPDELFKTYHKAMRSSLKKNYFHKFVESDKFTRYLQWKNLELSLHLTMSDFSVHRIIGRGGFGEVYGCRKADTGIMYAMKCLDKKRIKLKRGEALALNERHMLHMVDSPFIVCISYAFQSPDKLCFILDLMNGGDLHYHLTQRGTFTEDEVRFYGAEILLGIEHMHYHNIVYRDLKPANILLDEQGHTKISDLGLACDLSTKRPHASVGTHGYIAPEVLRKGASYDQGADWFSYGCTLFKLLKGHSPFRTRVMTDKNEIDKMTLTEEAKMPEEFSKEVALFIKGLLIKDPKERLGCRGRGATELKEAAFFSQVDWNQVEKQKYTPPLIPPRGEVNAADAFDIGNFDDDETKGIKLTEDDQAQYKDFDLIVSTRWQKEICDTVFDLVNQETDKAEAKRRTKQKLLPDNFQGDCLLSGYMFKLGGQLLGTWQKKYFYLFPNRLEWMEQGDSNLVVFERVTNIREGSAKGVKQCILISSRDSSKDIALRCESPPEFEQWLKDLRETWCQAKRVIKKGPKLISMHRSVAEHANYNKAILAAQTKAFQNNANNASYRHKVVEEPKVTHKVGALNLSS